MYNHLFDCSRINQASNTIALIISKIKNKNIYVPTKKMQFTHLLLYKCIGFRILFTNQYRVIYILNRVGQQLNPALGCGITIFFI